jgi:hypothetical protein
MPFSSTGNRGSASAECFLRAGYAVIFLHRANSMFPFTRKFSQMFSSGLPDAGAFDSAKQEYERATRWVGGPAGLVPSSEKASLPCQLVCQLSWCVSVRWWVSWCRAGASWCQWVRNLPIPRARTPPIATN